MQRRALLLGAVGVNVCFPLFAKTPFMEKNEKSRGCCTNDCPRPNCVSRPALWPPRRALLVYPLNIYAL